MAQQVLSYQEFNNWAYLPTLFTPFFIFRKNIIYITIVIIIIVILTITIIMLIIIITVIYFIFYKIQGIRLNRWGQVGLVIDLLVTTDLHSHLHILKIIKQNYSWQSMKTLLFIYWKFPEASTPKVLSRVYQI